MNSPTRSHCREKTIESARWNLRKSANYPNYPQYWGNHTHYYPNHPRNYPKLPHWELIGTPHYYPNIGAIIPTITDGATRYYPNHPRYYPNCLFGSKTTPTTKRYQALPTGTVRGTNW